MAIIDQTVLNEIPLKRPYAARKTCRYVSHGRAKRVMDFVLSIAILVAVWPIMTFIAVLLWVRNGSVIRRKAVIGQNGAEFEMLLYQTSDDPLLDRILRSSGLMYLPQLLNVISGRMSLVGPRPLQIQEFGKYNRIAGLYMKVRPGLTGLWFVSQERTMGEMAQSRLDRTYIKGGTILMDLAIILRTPFVYLNLS